jgi:capsule polysaccharide export protein KpsE/RkpR
MGENNNDTYQINKNDLFDFLIYLAGQKKRLLLNVIVTSIVAFLIVIFLPLKYKSSFSFIPPSGSSGFAASLLGDMSLGNLADVNNPTPPQVLFLINSSSTQEKLVHEFDLTKRYNTSKLKNPIESALRQLKKNIIIGETSIGGLGYEDIIGIEVSVVDRDPDTAFAMAQAFHREIENKFIEVFSRKSSFDMAFYKQVLDENNKALKEAQNSFLVFQKKTGIFAPTEQAAASLSLYSNLSAEIALRKVQLNIQTRNYGANSSEVRKLHEEINALSQELKSINSGPKNDFYIQLSRIPEQALEFFNRKRDLEIIEKTYLLLYQQFKQAEFQSKKNIPILKMVDFPQKPEYKFKPKRATILIGIVFIEFILFISTLAVAYLWRDQNLLNPKIRRTIDAWLTWR